MSDTDLWAAWRLWLAVAVVIIIVAVSLLVAIWVIARKILANAVRALVAGEKIRANTEAIWGLQTTNEVAVEILTTVQDIEAKGGALVAALGRKRTGESPAQQPGA
jgi:hypothetical protein